MMQKRKKQSIFSIVLTAVLLVAMIVAVAFACREIVVCAAEAMKKQEKTTSDEAYHNLPETPKMPAEGYAFSDDAAAAGGDLVLVNKDHPWDFSENIELVSIYDNKSASYFVRDKNVLLSEHVISHLNEMLDDFYRATGLRTINVVSGYRSLEDQRKIWDDTLENKGEEHTKRFVAKPGTSEHHTGLAVDFAIFYPETGLSDEFKGTGEYAWINENAWRYGFVERYKTSKESLTGIAGEPWHFRYTGLPHSKVMDDKGLCYEEYVELLKTGHAGPENALMVQAENQVFKVYSGTSDELQIPAAGEYELYAAGDIFIVTEKE